MALLLPIAPSQAMADQKTGFVLDNPDDPAVAAYFVGLVEGIEWTVSVVKDKRQYPYCPPLNLAITKEQYVSILRREVERQPDLRNAFAGYTMLRALKNAFPCLEK